MKAQKAKRSKPQRRYETWPIESLKPHPSQAHLFGHGSETENRDLIADLRKNKLIHAIEILSDGTIICGHQRVQAAKHLGWKTIRCWVRTDLEEQGPEAVETRLIEDNLSRRQLGKLGMARCYVRLRELARDGSYFAEEDITGDLRDYFAQRFGLSGRTLDRLAKMLKTPLPVQMAYERDELAQGQVLVIAKMDAHLQEEIAARIENGENAKEFLRSYLRRPKTARVSAEAVAFRVARELTNAQRELKGRFHTLPGRKLETQLEKFKLGQQFLNKLLKYIETAIAAEKSADNELNDLLDSLPERKPDKLSGIE